MSQQKFLVKKESLVISSPMNDSVRYHCLENSLNTVTPISVGVNSIETRPGCHYETSQLQIRNLPSTSPVIIDNEAAYSLQIIKNLDSLDSLLAEQASTRVNLTLLKDGLRKYDLDAFKAGNSVELLSKQIDLLDSIRTMSSFTPMKLDLSRPFHASNWMAFMFWLLTILAVILVWSTCRQFWWYDSAIYPLLTWPWRTLWSLAKTGWHKCKRDEAVVTRSESPDWVSNEPSRSRFSTPDIYNQEIEMTTPLVSIKSVPIPDSLPTPLDSPDGEPWKPVRAIYGNWQLRAVIHDNQQHPYPVYYNSKTGLLTDLDGTSLNVPGPTKEDVNSYYSIVTNSRLPPLFKDEQQKFRHKIYQFLYFDKKHASWIDEKTMSAIPGIPAPQGCTLYKPVYWNQRGEAR
jgi:hypothetical protein